LQWLSLIRTHGDNKWAPEILACLKEAHHWENMKDRREPLPPDMIHYLKAQYLPSNPHSLDHALFDWFITSIYGGFRLSEWAQNNHVHHRDQVKLNIEGQPMAFLIDDLQFFQENHFIMSWAEALCRPHLICSIDLHWHFQKNGMKNEKRCSSIFVGVVITIPHLVLYVLC
jgi:hypothetical protein